MNILFFILKTKLLLKRVFGKETEMRTLLGTMNEATVSRWCSNKMQPSLDMLVKIAGLLNVDPRQLINGGNND